MVSGEAGSATNILQEAIVACQGAKVQGGDRVRLFVPEDEDLSQRRDEIRWVGRLLQALEEDRFGLWVQKIAHIASGLSSFAYLKQLPADYLKIDGSYVRAMLEDEVAFAIVEAIHRIGKALNLETVAEFVESDALLEAVRKLGIDYAQGYAIHRPESVAGVSF